MKTKIRLIVALAFIGASLGVYSQTLPAPSSTPIAIRATTPEQAGDEKAAAGEYAGAIALYQKQWISCAAGINEGNAETQATRERLAEKLGNTLTKYQKSPVLSDETELYALKGAAFVKNAKSPADYEKAVKEFQDAVNGAPWMFDYQFNLAVALKSAKQFKFALGYARVAKLLAQTDKDRHDALGLRAEIEAAGEMADSATLKVQQEKTAAEKAEAERLAKPDFSGQWVRGDNTYDFLVQSDGSVALQMSGFPLGQFIGGHGRISGRTIEGSLDKVFLPSIQNYTCPGKFHVVLSQDNQTINMTMEDHCEGFPVGQQSFELKRKL